MDALKRSLGFTGTETPQRFQPTAIPRNHYPTADGGALDSISASMVIVEGPPSLDQRGAGGCIDQISGDGGSTGSPGNNSNSSVEGTTTVSAPQMKDRLVSMWNNMKFSKTIWAMDSKKANAFSSSSGSGFSNNSPVWIMGQCYHNRCARSGLSRQSSCDSNPDRDAEMLQKDGGYGTGIECSAAGFEALTADFHSKIWMTYRKDFEVFKGTHMDTDCGWGCMIRAGQMIVSNALLSLHLGRHWRWKCDDRRSVFTGDDIHNEGTHRGIIRLFADDPSAPFSIHKIVEIGQETINCKPGDWFGPGSTAHLFKQALHSTQSKLQKTNQSAARTIPDWCHVNLMSSFKIYVATDGTIYKQDVRDMCDNSNSNRKQEQSDDIDKDLTEMETGSLEKDGDFSFLERPDVLLSHYGECVESSSEGIRQPKHRSLECGIVDGVPYLVDDIEGASNINKGDPDESFDSVTEAVLLDDGIIRQYSLSQQLSVDGETWMTEEYSAANASLTATTSSTPISTNATHKHKERSRFQSDKLNARNISHSWTPVILLVPVRLGGGEKLNPIYATCVKSLLANENCVGIIGGRPRHALYFMGFQDDNLIHLDPHLVQDNVPMIEKQKGSADNILPLDFDLLSFHCQSIRKMPLSRMDPSCCLGFLCKTSSDFENWCEIIRDLATPSGATDYPIFSTMEGRASYHLAESERLFSQLMDSDGNEGTADNDKTDHGSAAGTSFNGASSGSDTDDFVFL